MKFAEELERLLSKNGIEGLKKQPRKHPEIIEPDWDDLETDLREDE